MPEHTEPALDPIEEAVATILLHGGAVELETDRLAGSPSRSQLRLSYRDRNRTRIALAGSVTAMADRHGSTMEALGWERVDILSMQRLERTWIRQAEERLQEHGIDYALTFVRAWELPPATAEDVVADLRATLAALDDRPSEQVQYLVQRDGPIERRVLRSTVAFGIISLVVGLFLAAYLIFRPQHVAPEVIVRAVLAGIATWALILFPVRRRIERMRGAGKWGWLPLWFGALVLPAATILAWALFGF